MTEYEIYCLVKKASPIIKQRFGAETALIQPVMIKEGARCDVMRAKIHPPADNVDSTIIKLLKETVEADLAFSDWASLSFLSKVSEAENIAPKFYGGDRFGRIYLIEDFGEGKSLDELIANNDQAALFSVFERWSLKTAKLHTSSMGREEEFDQVRRVLPQRGYLTRLQEGFRWLDNRPKMYAWFEALHLKMPEGFENALAEIGEKYSRPGIFLTFTHGDPAPTNLHISKEGVRLIDFEFGNFRHALYDLTAWNTLCPLPSAAVQRMSDLYRSELSNKIKEAADDAVYQQEWALMCAYRCFAMLAWIGTTILNENAPWVGEWSRREALLAAVERTSQACRNASTMTVIADAMSQLHETLSNRWQEYESGLSALKF